ncbi:MAG: hypothetical protein J1G30_03535 [Spirochaetales bacterium]|nr:hypothetical protein [Spirochaetales bacterium]
MKRLWFIFASIFILYSCAIEKIAELVSDGREIKSPEWNLDYELPILGKQIKMSDFIDLEKFLKEFQSNSGESTEDETAALIHMKLDPVTINSSDLNIDDSVTDLLGGSDPLTWPLPLQSYSAPDTMESSFPSFRMDMDNDNTDDITLDYLASSDGYLKITAKVFIIDSSSSEDGREATEEEYFVDGLPVFAISKIIISNKDFLFNEATYDKKNNCLTFIPNDFLSNPDSKLEPIPKDPTDLECIDYIFKFELPADSFSVRGKGFDVIENLMEGTNTRNRTTRSASAKSTTRARAELTAADIKDMIDKNGGGIEAVEDLITSGELTVNEIADAYQDSGDGINGFLEDLGDDVSISDVLSSDVISENIDDLEELVKDYDLGDGKTLGDVAEAGNLQDLSKFCSFHKTHNIKGLKVVFSVELNLGESFVFVGKFINDFKVSSLSEGSTKLPFSTVGKMLNEIKISADIKNTFSFPIDIKNARLKDSSGNEIPMLFDGEENNFRMPNNFEKNAEVTFSKPISEIPDSDLLLDIIIPKDSSCKIDKKNNSMLDMNIIATGNMDVKTNMFK